MPTSISKTASASRPPGSIRLSDATDPSPARIAEIRDKVGRTRHHHAPSPSRSSIRACLRPVFEGTTAKVGVIDPLGSSLELGPNLYPQFIGDVADSLVSCE